MFCTPQIHALIKWLGHAADPKPGSSYEPGSDGAAGQPPGPRRVPTGLPAAHGAAVGALGVPYLSCTPMRDSRVIRQALTGPVGPNQDSNGSLTSPDMARRDQTSPDG